jgi:hypothetical protein
MIYKINKQQADLIGKCPLNEFKVIDPYCGEQVDGTFIITEIQYLENKELFDSKIDFSSLPTIEVNKLNYKVLGK